MNGIACIKVLFPLPTAPTTAMRLPRVISMFKSKSTAGESRPHLRKEHERNMNNEYTYIIYVYKHIIYMYIIYVCMCVFLIKYIIYMYVY